MPARCRNREVLVLERRSSGRSGLSIDVKGMGKEFGGVLYLARWDGHGRNYCEGCGVVCIFPYDTHPHSSRGAANLHLLHHSSGGAK